MTHGYSLLELLIAVAILGLILMISTPSLRSGSSRQLQQDARTVEDLLKRFRNLSILSGTAYRVQIQPGLVTVTSTSGKEYAKHTLPLVRSTSGIPRGGVALHALGVVSPTTIVLRNQFARCSVTLSLRGRTRTTCVTLS